jgi:hypothetical protein
MGEAWEEIHRVQLYIQTAFLLDKKRNIALVKAMKKLDELERKLKENGNNQNPSSQ